MSTDYYEEHEDYLAPSPILDYESSLIQGVLSELKGADNSKGQRIAAYLFVRDRILFGYKDKHGFTQLGRIIGIYLTLFFQHIQPEDHFSLYHQKSLFFTGS